MSLMPPRQVAWRERQKHRIEGSEPPPPDRPVSLTRILTLPGLSSEGSCSNIINNNNNSGADSITNSPISDNINNCTDPMDESGDAYSSARETSGVESGSDTGGGGGGCGGGGMGGIASLKLGSGPSSEEMETREDRAAKALQTAARVMLARKGRFQKLAKETRALLLIQKRSREWLKQKQPPKNGADGVDGDCGDGGNDVPYSQGL